MKKIKIVFEVMGELTETDEDYIISIPDFWEGEGSAFSILF